MAREDGRLKINGIPMRKSTAERLILLKRNYTVAQIARMEGVSAEAIRKFRSRNEKKLCERLPRYETRGRKPKPLASIAA